MTVSHESCHISMSHVTYDMKPSNITKFKILTLWHIQMSHNDIWICHNVTILNFVTLLVFMSYVTWQCHTMSHFSKSLLQNYVHLSRLDFARNACKWVKSQSVMPHTNELFLPPKRKAHQQATNINESCHISMSHVTYAGATCHFQEISRLSYTWVMSHINESCHIGMSHAAYQWVMSRTKKSCLTEKGSARTNNFLYDMTYCDKRHVTCLTEKGSAPTNAPTNGATWLIVTHRSSQ